MKKTTTPDPAGYLLAQAAFTSATAATRNLADAGIETYCPRIREAYRNGAGQSIRYRAAFGNYLWITAEPFDFPQTMERKVRFLWRNGFYWFDQDEIEALRQIEQSWPVNNEDPKRQRYRTGTRVCISAGPFSGTDGVVAIDRGDRVKVVMGKGPFSGGIWLPPFMVAEKAGSPVAPLQAAPQAR